jgi:hypothetical protein
MAMAMGKTHPCVVPDSENITIGRKIIKATIPDIMRFNITKYTPCNRTFLSSVIWGLSP